MNSSDALAALVSSHESARLLSQGRDTAAFLVVKCLIGPRRCFPQSTLQHHLGFIIVGGFVGAALVYANYFHAISIFQGGITTTTPRPSLPFLLRLMYVSFFRVLTTTFLTTILLRRVSSCRTRREYRVSFRHIRPLPSFGSPHRRGNSAPTNGLLPVALLEMFVGIAVSTSMLTGTPLSFP